MKKTALLGLIPFLTSCATIVNGTHQTVSISTEPCGATVKLDCFDVGTTPTCIGMERSKNHFVTIELPGYRSETIKFDRRVSGWVFGNILLGGFFGLAIDAVSGSMYKLTPEQVNIAMTSESVISKENKNDIHLFVVMQPQEGWEKIGTLSRN